MLTFSFQDADVVVKAVHSDTLLGELEPIFQELAKRFESLRGPTDERPYL